MFRVRRCIRSFARRWNRAKPCRLRRPIAVQLTITFRTQEAYVPRFFLVLYILIVQISSPGYPSYYGPNLSCSYHFAVAVGWTIELQFSGLQLNVGDIIVIYDNEANTTIARYDERRSFRCFPFYFVKCIALALRTLAPFLAISVEREH